MKYSVIVATYNRAHLLGKCLTGLGSQSVNKNEYEIIIVDDGSSDNTVSVLRNFQKNRGDLNFQFITQKNKGVAAARNTGAFRARGDIIFFTDDDCIVPKNWIETLSDGYRRHPEIAGAGGWYEYPPQILKKPYVLHSRFLFFKAYGKNAIRYEINNALFLTNPAGNTSNMSYRKDIFLTNKGFNEKISFVGMVDWELKKRITDIGYPLLYIPHFVLHLKPLGVKEVARKFFNLGRGRRFMSDAYPELKPGYMVSLRRCIAGVTAPHIPFSIRWMEFIKFLFMRLGWEYQKHIVKFRTI